MTETQTVRMRHPNGGISKIVIAVSQTGHLDVLIDPSILNSYEIHTEDLTIAEGSATQ